MPSNSESRTLPLRDVLIPSGNTAYIEAISNPQNEVEETARIRAAQPRSGIGTQLGVQQEVQHALEGAEAVESRRKRKSTGFWAGAGMAFSTTTTAHLARELSPYLNGSIEPPDEDWKPSLQDTQLMLAEMGLQTTQHGMKRLMSANSAEQMYRYAKELKDQNEVQQIVGDRFWTNLMVQGADPVENVVMLTAAATTWGVGGALSLTARASRMASAAAQTGALTGAMYAGSRAGADYGPTQLLASAALALPLTYIGASPGRGIARPTKSTSRYDVLPDSPTPTRVEPVRPAAGTADASKVRKVESEVGTSPKQHQIAVDTARDTLRNLKEAAGIAGERLAWHRHLPERIRVNQDNIPRMIEDTVAEIRELKTAIAQAGGSPKAPEEAARIKELQADLKELQGTTSVAVSKYADITPQEYNAAVKEAKELAAADLREALEEVKSFERYLKNLEDSEIPINEVEGGIVQVDAVNAAVSPQGKQSVTEQLKSLQDVMYAAGVSPDDARRLTDAMVSTTQQQAGTFGARPNFATKAHRWFTELVSEHAKLTAGIPAIERMVSKVVDDPLQRAGLMGDNAASNLAVNMRKTNRALDEWEKALDEAVHEITGKAKWQTFMGYSDKHVEARLQVEDLVASDLLRRDAQAMRGEPVTASPDARIARLTELSEEFHHGVAQRAKEQGLIGFEYYERGAGYFHRSWNYDKMARIMQNEKPELVIGMLEQAILKGDTRLESVEATAIAKAIVARSRNKAQDARTDFMGQLGSQETESLVQLLRDGGTDPAIIESIERRLTQRLEDQGSVKYSKGRIPMDMTLSFKGEFGTYRMQDLIDADMSRLMQNYGSGMSGRSALAKVGIGGDTHSIATHLQHFRRELDKHSQLSVQQKDSMLRMYQNIIGDFTGIRQEGQVLGQGMQTVRALSTASLLGSTGLLQIPEGAIIAARHGFITTTKHMLREMPGIKHLLGDIAKDKRLLDEWETVTGMDFKMDLRLESWKRQVEMGFTQDSTALRLATAMQQMTPSVTGQRWVHSMQSDALVKLNLNALYRAARGDKKALELIREGGDNLTEGMLRQIADSAVVENGKLVSLGLERLPHSTLDAVTQTMTRLQDSMLLHQRPGFGTSYRHSAVGQLLGQFTSYVGMAHNVIGRRTYEHEGALGVAKVLAYQYPVLLATTYLNEARRGNLMDLSDENDLKELAQKALGYAAVVGLYGEAYNTVTNKSSRSIAAGAPLTSFGNVWAAMGAGAQGDFGTMSAETLGAINAGSIMGAVPGSQILEKILKDD